MLLAEIEQQMMFRDLELTARGMRYVCPTCGFEAATIKQANAVQQMLSNIYREKKGLLTGRKIRNERKKQNMTQQDLADVMCVGIASIKRWEGQTIQTPGMDKLLRQALQPTEWEGRVTGGRRISLARIKRVLLEFQRFYQGELIGDHDRIGILAQLVWYADMIAYRELGRSMTGATYVALSTGPHLSNFNELAGDILQSDEQQVRELTAEEKKIIGTVFKKFPRQSDAGKSSCREGIWKKRKIGEIIPYTDSSDLQEL